MRLISKDSNTVISRLADGTVVETLTRWVGSVQGDDGRIVQFDFDHDPSDDEITARLPAPTRRLAPTSAVGKAALKDMLDAQIELAHEWEWFASKIAADGAVPALAKTAVQGLADAEYAEAKRLALAWRQAV